MPRRKDFDPDHAQVRYRRLPPNATTAEVAAALGVTERTVRRWRVEYAESLGHKNPDPIAAALVVKGIERCDAKGWPAGCASRAWKDRVRELVEWKGGVYELRVWFDKGAPLDIEGLDEDKRTMRQLFGFNKTMRLGSKRIYRWLSGEDVPQGQWREAITWAIYYCRRDPAVNEWPVRVERLLDATGGVAELGMLLRMRKTPNIIYEWLSGYEKPSVYWQRKLRAAEAALEQSPKIPVPKTEKRCRSDTP